MKKKHVIKYLRKGSRLINRHSKEIYIVTKVYAMGFELRPERGGLHTSELRSDMGLYFKRERKSHTK